MQKPIFHWIFLPRKQNFDRFLILLYNSKKLHAINKDSGLNHWNRLSVSFNLFVYIKFRTSHLTSCQFFTFFLVFSGNFARIFKNWICTSESQINFKINEKLYKWQFDITPSIIHICTYFWKVFCNIFQTPRRNV